MNHCRGPALPESILAVLLAAALLAFAGSYPASAQFVCTTTATDVTCNNSGTAASEANFDLSKNVTTNNSGTVTTSMSSTTGNSGNATTTNTGSVGTDINTTSSTTGDAATTNHGSVGGSIFTIAINGNATGFNDGTIGGQFSTLNEFSGVASAINHGTIGGAFTVTSVFGSVTLTNYGSAASLSAVAPGTGTATTVNMGSVSTSISTQTVDGNATTINSGSVGTSMSNFSANTGIATAINTGSIGTNLQNTGVGGNAVTTNTGFVGGNMTTLADLNGDAIVTNGGSVGGVIGATSVFHNATVTNYGSAGGITISAPAGGAATVTNFGIVSGLVQLFANTAQTLTNAGVISNPGGTAIQFSGAVESTLTLLPGSFIVGGITLNAAAANTVNLDRGNLNMNFNTLAGATVTGTVPFAALGNQAASVDPTPFGMTDRNLMDFSRNVSSAIPVIQGQDAAATQAMAFSGTSSDSRITDAFDAIPGLSAYANDRALFANPTAVYRNGWSLWARGFAGQREQPADGTSLHTLNQFYGGMFGGDLPMQANLRIGAFGGAGETRSSVDFNYGDTISNVVFAGMYAHYSQGILFAQAVMQGGHSINDSTRNINNNLVPGGIETAKASYGGTYFSPEGTLGARFALGSLHGASYTLTPSVNVRYLVSEFDGYTESGSTANLSVGDRIVQDVEEKGQLKLTGTRVISANHVVMGNIYAGVLGVQRVGSTTINATLLGQEIPFATPGNSSVLGGFGGLGIEWHSGRVVLFGSVEYTGFADSSSVISGRGGVKVAF